MTNKKTDTSLIVPKTSYSENSQVDRFERVVTLAPGQFWRALQDAKEDGGYLVVPEGRMHMIDDVKTVDDLAHTIVLRAHPGESQYNQYQFLVENFLNWFEHVENYQAVRDSEIAALQEEIGEQQSDLERVGRDPSYAMGLLITEKNQDDEENNELDELDRDAGLPPGNQAGSELSAIVQGDIELAKKQLKNQSIVIGATAKIIEKKSKELSDTVAKLTPFYTERAQSLVASAKDAVKYVKKVQQGLHTLALYTGEDVEVERIKEGASASSDIPYALRQKLLYMNEESLLHAEFDGGDFENFGEFSEKLCTDPALVQRIMPEQRCIVAMKYRRTRREYGDAWENYQKNEINRQTFLLIRDGENIYAVFSPLTYLDRLFPSKSDGESPFTGYDGTKITIDDVRYADSKDKFEDTALMYRRLLIMLWGLHDRTDVLGPLAVDERFGHANLLSVDIQNEVFQFIYDDEPEMLLGESKKPSFRDWCAQKNELLRSGSRVAIRWDREGIFNYDTAPYCFSQDGRYARYTPESEWSLAIVRKEKESLYVKTEVSGYTRTGDEPRNFFAKVTLPGLSRIYPGDVLCLDDVSPEEILYYINSRAERESYLEYIPLFVGAYKQLVVDVKDAAELKSDIGRALVDANMAPSDNMPNDILDRTIRKYRVGQRWSPVPDKGTDEYRKALESILGQIWVVLGKGRDRVRDAHSIAKSEGRVPLRLSITGNNSLVLYATPADSEIETRVGKHVWVRRLLLQEKKTKISVTNRTWVRLQKTHPEETMLHEWSESAEWIQDGKQEHSLSYEQAQKVTDRIETECSDLMRFLTSTMSDEEYEDFVLKLYRKTMQQSGKYVSRPSMRVPFAIVSEVTTKYVDPSMNERQCRALCLDLDTWSILWSIGTEKQKQMAEAAIKRIYSRPEHFLDELRTFKKGESLRSFGLAKIETLTRKEIKFRGAVRNPTTNKDYPTQRTLYDMDLLWLPETVKAEHLMDLFNDGNLGAGYATGMKDYFATIKKESV